MSNAKKKHPFLKCLIWLAVLIVSIPLLQQAVWRFRQIIYPLKFTQTVEAICEEYDVSPSLVYAVIHTESKFNPSALSPAGAKGLMQLTDDTYLWALQRAKKTENFNPEQLYTPEENIRWGVYVLTLLEEQFSVLETQLAAYNAGQGHVQEWLNDPQYSSDGATLHTIPYKETTQYVQRVLNARQQYQTLYSID